MRNIYFILLTVLLPSVFYSQTEMYTYGRPDSKYLKMESYDKDPEANALIIYEKGDSEIKWDRHDNLSIFHTYKARVKIFTKEGFDEATFKIWLYHNDSGDRAESVDDIRASSYNMDAPPLALDKNDIFKEKYDDHWDVVKFTIPKVKEGTVFDVEYTHISPFMFHFPGWKFQSHLPKLYSEYNTKIPANYKYNAQIVGSLKFAEQTTDVVKKCIEAPNGASADCGVYHLVMKDVPAFKEEDYMTSADNYISQVKYELSETESFTGIKAKYSKTWKDVDYELKSWDIGKQARKERAFEKLLPENIAAMPHDMEQAKAIYYMLQKEMVWNGDNNVLNDIDVKKAYDEKKGSVGDLNLVLLNMLKAAGFEAYAVLIRKRDDGFPTLLYPVITDFNYLVVKIILDEKTYYLDITDSYLPFGMLPKKALNYYGRVMDFENESDWDNIMMGSLSTQTIFLQYELNSEGKLTLKISDKTNGFFGVSKRKEISKHSETDYLKEFENELSNDNNAIVTNYKKYNETDPEKMLFENFEVEFEDNLDGKQLFLKPLNEWVISKNPFKLEERSYPVDFGYPYSIVVKALIKADESYEFSHIPENVSYDYKNLMKLEMKVLNQGSNLTLDLSFYVYKSIFDPEEYQEVKKMFGELASIANTDIILKKKE